MSQQVLIICAHPDDEVIGAGGAIAHHIYNGDTVNIIFLSDGESSRNCDSIISDIEARQQSAYKSCSILGSNKPIFHDFSDNMMDSYNLLEIVKVVEKEVAHYKPSIIYTHHSGDLNIDHRITNKAVLTACRPTPECVVEKIYTFEVLSSTNWSSRQENNLFNPNHYIDITPYFEKKMNALECYIGEIRPYPHSRSFESVKALAIYRGTTVGMCYAEAFFIERSIERTK
jgi:LmbE family N-acetylglucosaminyl deacetylase